MKRPPFSTQLVMLWALVATLCATLVAVVWVMASSAEGQQIAGARAAGEAACEAVASRYDASAPAGAQPDSALMHAILDIVLARAGHGRRFLDGRRRTRGERFSRVFLSDLSGQRHQARRAGRGNAADSPHAARGRRDACHDVECGRGRAGCRDRGGVSGPRRIGAVRLDADARPPAARPARRAAGDGPCRCARGDSRDRGGARHRAAALEGQSRADRGRVGARRPRTAPAVCRRARSRPDHRCVQRACAARRATATAGRRTPHAARAGGTLRDARQTGRAGRARDSQPDGRDAPESRKRAGRRQPTAARTRCA